MSVIDEEIKRMRDKLQTMNNTIVRVALFGQPGAGKSSLINKIVGQKVAEAGVETDKTVDLAWYEAKGLKFADLPGYGTKNFPKDSYFQKFDIGQFDLFLCVTSGKFHQADTEFFQELKKAGKVCIFVVNKHDELWEEDVTIEELEQRKRNDVFKQVGQKVNVLFTSCRKNTGLDELNEEIRNNLDGAKRERWERGAKAYSVHFLQEKKAACKKYIYLASGSAAVNAINPIPGTDIAIDVSIILLMFKNIRDDYGLDDNVLNSLINSPVPFLGQLGRDLIQEGTKEGILLLLRRFAKQEIVKEVAKYIPFVGQAVAATIGYAITRNAGNKYLNDCHKLAEELLQNNLRG